MNPFYFFYKKILHAQEHKKHKNYKKRKDATKQKQRKHKKYKNANKQISYFFPLKCFLCICKRCLFCFCSLICLLCYFVRVKSFCKKKKKFQTALMTSFTLLPWSHSVLLTLQCENFDFPRNATEAWEWSFSLC